MSALSATREVKPAVKAAFSTILDFVFAIGLAALGVTGGLAVSGALIVLGTFLLAGLVSAGHAYYRGEDVRDAVIDDGRHYVVVFALLVPAMIGSVVYQQLASEWAAALAFLGLLVSAMAVFAFMQVEPDDPVDFLRWSA